MALALIEALGQTALERARELSVQWGVPTLEEFQSVEARPREGVKVVVSDSAIGLGFVEPKRGKPYYVDFLSRAWQVRISAGLPRNHIFRRALGYKGEPLKVIDATAGFGQDSMQILCLGCEVIAVESSPVVVTLLRDGVRRAQEDELVGALLQRLSIQEDNALHYLSRAAEADVIYVDPMFDKFKKSAKSPKEMQLLQELLGPADIDETERLLDLALNTARQRVVVKRPLKAKALGDRAPSLMFKGQSVRYDVYS
jgi:16S rRNA (guanine1516-N2)-methyltransferase